MGTARGTVDVVEDGAVWYVALSNPDKRNAFTWAMYDEFERVCRRAAGDSDVRAVVLRGAGGEAFAAGTDITQFVGFDGQRGVEYEHTVGRVLTALLAVPVPVVAVVEGPAVGAGLAVAACSDIVLASSDAVFGAPVARTLGNCLSPMVVRRLQRRMGAGPTAAVLLGSTLLSAERARETGLVAEVAGRSELDQRCARLVDGLRARAPLSLAAFKGIDRRLEAADDVDADDLLYRCYDSEDFREGVSAFVEHRAPEWRGR